MIELRYNKDEKLEYRTAITVGQYRGLYANSYAGELQWDEWKIVPSVEKEVVSPIHDGLRTEKIMLEITHCCMYPVAEWVLELIQDTCTDPGESVRVVPEWDQIRESCDRVSREALTEEVEALNKEIDRLTDERDAAIRVAELEAARGWLTAEERDAVEFARAYYHAQTCGMNEDGGWYRLHKQRQLACESLLARSSPPEVVLPWGTQANR